MKRFKSFVAAVLFSAALAVPAIGGIADSPLPVLVAGKTTLHLYSVPGVVNNGPFATFFSCTSTDTAAMQVGVEVFGDFGGAPANDAVATSATLDPGMSATFRSSRQNRRSSVSRRSTLA